MRTGLRWKRLSGALLLAAAVLCMGSASVASTAQQHVQKKKAPKKVPLVPLPIGPTGPVQPIPLDAIAAVPPQVSYQNNQLTIVAPNSTLGDILRAVRKQTGAEIEVPAAPERVVTHLGPGPARDVVAELLNGSRFNYVLLGSPADDAVLTKVVLVAKTGPDTITPTPPTPDPALGIAEGPTSAPPQEPPPDMAEADQSDDNAANADDQAVQDQATQEAAEQQANPDQQQPGVKTPQQMLQEMQQRQLQLQQQQQPGQPPVPGSGMPPHPPREQ